MESVVSYPERGKGGNNHYRGNCSPKLIEDIIDQYGVKYLSDYMVGSGTTEDVCRDRGIAGHYMDLNRGFDLLSMEIPDRPENIFWHPPYNDIVVYSDNMYSAQMIIDRFGYDPRKSDLSRCSTWDDFVKRMNYCCIKQFTALEKGGRMFILMGDIKKKGRLYSMLHEITWCGVPENVIIKLQHNCVSDGRQYNGRFVPIVHEYMLVIRKDNAIIIPISYTKNIHMDIRDSQSATWRDVVASVLEDYGPSTLEQIYSRIDGHRKTRTNKHWKDKIRQTLQTYPVFNQVKRGIWESQAA